MSNTTMIRFLVNPKRTPIVALVKKGYKTELNHAVKEAEKVVGYSSSFLNLRWILTDEMANVAIHIKNLIGINHPLLHTAKKMFMGTTVPTWGLIVLLLSKAAGLNNIDKEIDKDNTAGVLNTQRALAEITEMIRMSQIIHSSIIHIRDSDYIKDLNFGNKIALLSGDYLLCISSQELANLRNQDVTLLMSSALRDLIEFQFLDYKPYKPISTEPIIIENNYGVSLYNCKQYFGNPRAEWMYRSILGGASLLAKACQSALKLTNLSEHMQELGHSFGKTLALAWQAQLEKEAFISYTDNSTFSLVSAPIMLHLEHDASLFDLIQEEHVNYNRIFKLVSVGKGLQETRMLQNELCCKAIRLLTELPKSDACTALQNIIKTIN